MREHNPSPGIRRIVRVSGCGEREAKPCGQCEGRIPEVSSDLRVSSLADGGIILEQGHCTSASRPLSPARAPVTAAAVAALSPPESVPEAIPVE